MTFFFIFNFRKVRLDSSCESLPSTWFTWNTSSYFLRKILKQSFRMSSAAVVIRWHFKSELFISHIFKQGLTFHVNHLSGRWFTWNVKPYFLWKMSSAAVVISTLRVKCCEKVLAPEVKSKSIILVLLSFEPDRLMVCIFWASSFCCSRNLARLLGLSCAIVGFFFCPPCSQLLQQNFLTLIVWFLTSIPES